MLRIFDLDFDPVHQLDALLLGLDLFRCEFRLRSNKAYASRINFARIGIRRDLGLGAQLDFAEVGLVDVPPQPGMFDVADRHHGGPRGQDFAHVRRLHQHDPIHR